MSGASHKAYVLCIVLFLLLPVVVTADGPFRLIETPLYEEIKANRPTDTGAPQPDLEARFRKLLYKYDDLSDEPQEDEIVVDTAASSPWLITKEQAREEVAFLFRVLKFGYAGYQYFGGDETFIGARNAIIADIEGFPESKLDSRRYVGVIRRHLGFIQDGHFFLGGVRTCRDYEYYSNEEYTFVRDDAGFCMATGGKRRYLLNVDGQDPAAYLRLSIDAGGNAVYQPGVLSADGVGVALDLFFDDGTSESVQLEKVVSGLLSGPVYERKEIGGIPVIVNRSLERAPQNFPTFDAFVSDAEKLREERVIVLDLRSNVGGSSEFVDKWVYSLTGEHPGYAVLAAPLMTNTAAKLRLNSVRRFGDEAVEALKEMYEGWEQEAAEAGRTSCPGWGGIYSSENVTINNRPLVVVLTDSHVASAGEGFVRALAQLDNVVFIGLNTYGALLTGDVGVCQLPHSKLYLAVGTSLLQEKDFVNRDGLGYFPDFWVDPDHALDRALKFINKYFR